MTYLILWNSINGSIQVYKIKQSTPFLYLKIYITNKHNTGKSNAILHTNLYLQSPIPKKDLNTSLTL